MTHSGVTLAPILARIIKTEIVDKEHVSEIDFYRIKRFYK
jgi:glycine/D-amino acid oxidase-like deaminating enzyme